MRKLPKSVTATMYIHVIQYSDKVQLFPFDMTSVGYILLGTTEVTFDVPQVDLVAMEIKSIEREKAMVVKEYEEKLAMIAEELSGLRSLTYEGETA